MEALRKGLKWYDALGIMDLHDAQAELISPLVQIRLHILTRANTKIQHNYNEAP